MELLDERELTKAERAAVADEPRPGAWIERDLHGIEDGDGRLLTQEQTDAAIVDELTQRCDEGVTAALGEPRSVELDDGRTASQQRGGIHSDPLARLLAYRQWGERDRAWRKRDTARALIGEIEEEYLDMEDSAMSDSCGRAYGFDTTKVTASRTLELAAQRGGAKAKAACSEDAISEMSSTDEFVELYLDLFDEVDRKLPAAGPPKPAASKKATTKKATTKKAAMTKKAATTKQSAAAKKHATKNKRAATKKHAPKKR